MPFYKLFSYGRIKGALIDCFYSIKCFYVFFFYYIFILEPYLEGYFDTWLEPYLEFYLEFYAIESKSSPDFSLLSVIDFWLGFELLLSSFRTDFVGNMFSLIISFDSCSVFETLLTDTGLGPFGLIF